MAGKIRFSDFDIQPNAFTCKVLADDRDKQDQLTFELSDAEGDLRRYPDSIALALATLCGQKYDTVEMPLLISDDMVKSLESWTKARWITVKRGRLKALLARCFRRGATEQAAPAEKVDPKSIILNFSGGFDSLAAKALLPDTVRLVAVDFGGWFAREADFFNQFHPITLKTNFRDLRYHLTHWTFMGVGSLLYAKLLGAEYIVFGTALEETPYHFRKKPSIAYSSKMEPFNLLGLKYICATNGITEVGTTMVITRYFPEMVVDSLRSLAPAGSEKLYRKQVVTGLVAKKFHRPIGEIVYSEPNTAEEALPFGKDLAVDFGMLYELKYAGKEIVQKTVLNIPEEAYELADRLTLRFYERFNPTFLNGIPEPMRQDYLKKLADADIVPYEEEDWEEYDQVRDFLSKYYSIMLG